MLQLSGRTIGVISIATPFFDLEVAREALHRTRATLQDYRVVGPTEVIVEPADLDAAIESLRADRPDVLLLQIGTFPDGEAPPRLAIALGVPIIVHALPEPDPKRRISLNSLCGANATTFTLSSMDHPHVAVFGDPESEELATAVRAALAVQSLRGTRIGLLGGHPQGFYPSAYDELDLLRELGVIVEHVSLHELHTDESSPRREAPMAMVLADGSPVSDELIAEQERRYERLSSVLEARPDIAGWAIKDWPELWGMWPAIGWAQDDGHVVGVEGDLHAALTMLVQQAVGGGHQALIDLSAFDDADGTLTLWHYGAPTRLARDDASFVHDADHGQNVQFPLKPGLASLARIGTFRGEYRLLTIDVEITDEVVELERASGLARTLRTAPGDIVRQMLDGGWDHHVVLGYGDLDGAWRAVAKLLGIPRTAL